MNCTLWVVLMFVCWLAVIVGFELVCLNVGDICNKWLLCVGIWCLFEVCLLIFCFDSFWFTLGIGFVFLFWGLIAYAGWLYWFEVCCLLSLLFRVLCYCAWFVLVTVWFCLFLFSFVVVGYIFDYIVVLFWCRFWLFFVELCLIYFGLFVR